MSASTPHAFPCRLVERVEPCAGGRAAVVLATAGGMLTGPGEWPVSLVAEAMAQSILLVDPPPDMAALRLVGLHGVSVVLPPRPGDRLEVDVERVATFGRLRRYRCRALRAGALAVTAEITVSS